MIFPLQIKVPRVIERPFGRDPRVKRTLAFFARKGFLDISRLLWTFNGQLTLGEVMWTCAHVTPEIYEVVPAARLRFPGYLRGRPPEDLQIVLAALKAGATHGPDFRGHAYASIRQWLDYPLHDRRAAPVLTTHVHYKIQPDLARRLKLVAQGRQMSASQLVIDALEKYLLGTEGQRPPAEPFIVRR